jgi:hypothetical protein
MLQKEPWKPRRRQQKNCCRRAAISLLFFFFCFFLRCLESIFVLLFSLFRCSKMTNVPEIQYVRMYRDKLWIIWICVQYFRQRSSFYSRADKPVACAIAIIKRMQMLSKLLYMACVIVTMNRHSKLWDNKSVAIRRKWSSAGKVLKHVLWKSNNAVDETVSWKRDNDI